MNRGVRLLLWSTPQLSLSLSLSIECVSLKITIPFSMIVREDNSFIQESRLTVSFDEYLFLSRTGTIGDDS